MRAQACINFTGGVFVDYVVLVGYDFSHRHRQALLQSQRLFILIQLLAFWYYIVSIVCDKCGLN